jgi:hypothetical protein
MRHGRFGLTFVLLFASAVVGPGAIRTFGQPASGLLWLNPEASEVQPGDSASLALQLDNIMNVYGIEVQVGFDPAILSVADVALGVCPQPDFVVVNNVAMGTFSYATSQLSPTQPCNGGVVATIELECAPDADAGTVISIDSSLVVDPDGLPLGHSTQNAVVNCRVQPTLTVSRIGAGSGTVFSDPLGIDCGGDCSESYAPGTEIGLTATGDLGSTFDGWGGHCSGTLPSTSVLMNISRTCTATFETCLPVKDVSGLDIADEQYFEACNTLQVQDLRILGPNGIATLIAGERIGLGNGLEVLEGATLILGLDPTLKP